MEKPINTESRGKVACLLLEVEANIHGQNTQEVTVNLKHAGITKLRKQGIA
jgi:hypothetical protein